MTTQLDTLLPRKGSGQPQSLVRCRVCLKHLNDGESYMSVYHAGVHHLVCCASCAAKFEANPSLYLVE